MACLAAALTVVLAPPMHGQGMPPGARQNIHTLLNGHDQIERVLTLTKDGYEAVTRSTNSTIAEALQNHVQQMQDRLDQGLAARRWDPAFAEYRSYYAQIDVQIETIESGVKVVATGRTPEAAKVAQNHASIINEFANAGWSAHDTFHPAVLNHINSKPSARTNCGGCISERGMDQTGCCAGCPAGRAVGQADNR